MERLTPARATIATTCQLVYRSMIMQIDQCASIDDRKVVTGLSGRLPDFPILSHTGRPFPSLQVTRETIKQAFVQFILCCNPAYDAVDNYAYLEESLCTPPSCSKQAFHLYDIFQQVKQLNTQKVKTWHQLVLNLGVEPVPLEEGRAVSQLIPQFVVRLRRWLKHVHADAYFDYLLGKPHEYYTKVPLSSNELAESRVGIPPSEDLALRALDPELRPKRGRKRQQEFMHDLPQAQQHSLSAVILDQRTPLSALPLSAYPQSAFPHSPSGTDPWSSVSDFSLDTSIHKFRVNSPGTVSSSKASRPAQQALSTLDKGPVEALRGQKLHLQVPSYFGNPIAAMTPIQSTPDHTIALPLTIGAASTVAGSSPATAQGGVPGSEVNDGLEFDWRARCEQLQQENDMLHAKLVRAKAKLNEVMDAL